MTQPILPAEETPTNAELEFIDSSPPGLWPENQDSNFGQIRKVFTDIIQECIDEIDHLGREMFVATSSQYLSLWEEQVGAPIAPAGKSDIDRRAAIISRIKYGLFTRARINALVESFLIPTFGAAAEFSPSGIPFDAGGIALYSGATDLTGAYRVYYNPRNFSYEVWIRSDLTPDIGSLTKALQRITPAHISVSIVNTHSSVLAYEWTIRNKQPIGYWRLDDNALDHSGNAFNGTKFGTPTTAVAPGLLAVNAVAQNQSGGATAGDGAINFDGVDDYISVPASALFSSLRDVSVEAWIKFDTVPAGSAYQTVFVRNSSFWLRTQAGPGIWFYTYNPALAAWSSARVTTGLATGQIYHVVGVKRGTTLEVWINGGRADTSSSGVVPDFTNSTVVGGTISDATGLFDGIIDEVAVYDRALSADEILENYNTGKNIAS